MLKASITWTLPGQPRLVGDLVFHILDVNGDIVSCRVSLKGLGVYIDRDYSFDRAALAELSADVQSMAESRSGAAWLYDIEESFAIAFARPRSARSGVLLAMEVWVPWWSKADIECCFNPQGRYAEVRGDVGPGLRITAGDLQLDLDRLAVFISALNEAIEVLSQQ